MTPPTLTSPPARFVAGDTVAFTVSVPSYPATDGGTMTFAAAGVSMLAAQTAVADGSAWAFTIAAATSALLGAGAYTWRLTHTLDGVRHTVETGVFTVDPDFSALTDGDHLSWAAKTLPIVEAALASVLEGEQKGYMIEGRQVQFLSTAELLNVRARCMRELADERRGSAFGRVSVAFTR